MRKNILLLMLAVCLGVFGASAEQKILTINSRYKAIDVSCGANVTYNPGSSRNTIVEINGPAEKISWVEVTVSKGALSISVKKEDNGSSNSSRIKGVTIKVSGPLVNSIHTSSSGKLTSSTRFEFRKSTVNLSASSSGEINLIQVTAPAIQANVSSSGEINVTTAHAKRMIMHASSSGEIEIKQANFSTCNAQSTSSGDISIDNLTANATTLQATSSGDIEIDYINTSTITAQASSGGDISVSGKTTAVNASASSGGDINLKKLSYTRSNIRSSSGGSIHEH